MLHVRESSEECIEPLQMCCFQLYVSPSCSHRPHYLEVFVTAGLCGLQQTEVWVNFIPADEKGGLTEFYPPMFLWIVAVRPSLYRLSPSLSLLLISMFHLPPFSLLLRSIK